MQASSRGADLKAGITCTELLVKDLNGDDRADIVVTDQLSGDLSVFINEKLDLLAVFGTSGAIAPASPTTVTR